MSCCGSVNCGLSCPHALLGWSAHLVESPITFAAYMALSPKDTAIGAVSAEEADIRVPA